MNCVHNCMSTLHDQAYNHHIQRLMVLGNLAMLHGVDPWELTEWMWSSFIDGAEWVMLPNVIGMSQWADGGMMATKPYAAGRQLHRQDERLLHGPAATTASNVSATTPARSPPSTGTSWRGTTTLLVRNPRVARQVRASERLSDLPAVRERAVEVRRRLDDGTL